MSIEAQKRELANYLFGGLNNKLNDLGLDIAAATLGFRQDMSVSEIFANSKKQRLFSQSDKPINPPCNARPYMSHTIEQAEELRAKAISILLAERQQIDDALASLSYGAAQPQPQKHYRKKIVSIDSGAEPIPSATQA